MFNILENTKGAESDCSGVWPEPVVVDSVKTSEEASLESVIHVIMLLWSYEATVGCKEYK